MCIDVDHVFVIARTVTLNWEIPIGVLGLGVFWGYFDTMVTWQHFFWCLNKFKEMLKDNGSLSQSNRYRWPVRKAIS